MNAYLIALRMLLRDWRGGELGILLLALIVAVAMVSGISSFTSRLQASLEQESHRFLAADLVISSPREVPGEWSEEAERRGILTAGVLNFPSMVASDSSMQLASVKAVSPGYPLRGDLRMSDVPFGNPVIAETGPAVGQIWLDSRLFPLLGVVVGDTVFVGDAELMVSGSVRSEPDAATSFAGYGPRVMLNLADIPATGVVQPGSRVEYRYLYAGDSGAIAAFSGWLEPLLSPSHSLIDVENSEPRVARSLDRAERFLLLAGSLGVVLAGIAIALAARRFSERHYDHVAILKSLGATQAKINALYSTSLLVLGVVATVLGWILGWMIQQGFLRIFSEFLPELSAEPGYWPFVVGGVTGLVCLFCYAWPPLLRLSGASPLRVLRRDMPGENLRSVLDYLLGLVAIVLLMYWYSRNLALTAAVLAGMAIAILIVGAAALLLLRGGREAGMRAGSVWRLALSGLQRRGRDNAIQIVIFALAIMLLLVLALVRTSLIEDWQVQLPDGTPNHFMINVAPDEEPQVRDWMDVNGVERQPLYPMVRGRITHIGEQTLEERQSQDQEALDWELNMTWSEDLPPDNDIVAGEWWSGSHPQVSVEEEAADRLNIQIGEKIRFLIGSEELVAEVTSFRSLDWESLQPNFYMVFNPEGLVGYPSTYMTSFYLSADDKLLLNEFISSYPTITVIEMDLVIEQIKSIINQVTMAIELVLMVILAAGALVLAAGVQSSLDQRLQESAIVRALGGQRNLILGGLVIEFATLGVFAGFLGSVGAELAVFFIQRELLEMSYSPHPIMWLYGPLSGALIIGLVGVASCRKVVSTPPLNVLREL